MWVFCYTLILSPNKDMFLSVGMLGIAAVYVLIYGTSQRRAEYTVTDPHPQHTSTGDVTERTYKRRAVGDDIVEVVESEPTVCDRWSNAEKMGKAEMARDVKKFLSHSPKFFEAQAGHPMGEDTPERYDHWVQHYKCTAPITEDPGLRIVNINDKFMRDSFDWFGIDRSKD